MGMAAAGTADGAASRAVPRGRAPATTGSAAVSGAVATWLETERTQWFNWLPVALGCGIAAYFALPAEPETWAALAPLPAAVLLWRVCRRGSILAALTGAVAMACLGLALAKLRTDSVAAPVLERRMGPVAVRGHIELVEPRETRGERLTIRVAEIDGVARERTPRTVRIRTMNANRDGVALKPGDGVRVKAHLAPPSGPVLPGGYDFARGAYFQGLGGIGYALSRAEPDTAAGPPDGSLVWRAAIARLRQDISARVTAALPGQTGAIATALISGERGAISTATNDTYRDSGLYHVLSISGLHMAIMGGAVFYAIRILFALFPAVALRYPIKKWAAVAAILASLGYLALSGAAFATVRSAVTITIMFLAIVLDRPAIAMRNVALAALLILLVWPESLTDVGFQMSFAAVVALVACYEAVRRRLVGRAQWPEHAPAKLALFLGGIVLSTLIASLAVAPFGAYYFHKSQQLAIVANVVATPVINLVIMPAALGALVLMPAGLEALPLALMGYGIDATTWVAQWVAALPGAATRIPAISPLSFLLMIGGGLWLLLWKERPRWLGFVAILAGIALAPATPRPDLLAGHDGRLIAVRGSDGHLAALAGPQTGFELGRWLEHDGDARSPKEAMATPGFRCDDAGCTARVRGLVVAHSRHPSAIADDCARADIVLLTVPRPKGCTRPKAVIDFFALRGQGTHAVYLSPPGNQQAPGKSSPGEAVASADPRPVAALPASDGASTAAITGASGGTPGAASDKVSIVASVPADAAMRARPHGDPRDGGPIDGNHRHGALKHGALKHGEPKHAGAALADPHIRIVTVAAARGDRPWSRLPWWAASRSTESGAPDSAAPAYGATSQRSGSQPTGTPGFGTPRAVWQQSGHASARPTNRSRLAAFAATPEFLASQSLTRAEAEVEDALADPSLYDERW